MKKITFGIALLSCCLQLTLAQENVLASGLNTQSSSGTVTYSVGLIHYKEAEGIGGSSSTGVQIPYEVTEVLSVNQFNELVSKVFPNPTENFLNVHLNEVNNLSYQFIDLSGRTVLSGELNKLASKIELTSLEASIYVFNIKKENAIIKSYKISKK